ncbi:TY-Chap domain-containing protein [Nocardia wallacei]|uniref:TY-Chap domain-containing protein n=1 Tax=Nocardia wallacei TaxID=480035 RepID=UPI002454E4F5|nr:hypothetical protein [Nocardia wallacei]
MSEAVEDDVWAWFSTALAWTLFRLPVDAKLILSTTGNRYVQFARHSDVLQCEVVSNDFLDADHHIPSAVEARLRAQGWERGSVYNWGRIVRWPAFFRDYELVADFVVSALREALGVWLPLVLIPRTWIDGSDRLPDIGMLHLGGFSEKGLRSAPPGRLRELVRLLESDVIGAQRFAASSQKMRGLYGRDYLKSRDIEILTCPDGARPMRDRTVDFIGVAGVDHLLVVDVILDVEDADNVDVDALPLEVRGIGGARAQQGSLPHVEAMVRADPDFQAALEQRPDLASALGRGAIRIDYHLMLIDIDQKICIVAMKMNRDC